MRKARLYCFMLMDIVYLYFKTKETKSKRYRKPAAGRNLEGAARH